VTVAPNASNPLQTMQQSTGIGPREAGVRSSWVGYQWSEYEEDSGDDIPRWLEEKLKQVRPVTSGPADFVLAARLCVSEALAGRNHKRSGRRPLTAGEIIENWVEMKDVLYMRCNTTVEELEHMFTEERRAWMDTDRSPQIPYKTSHTLTIDHGHRSRHTNQ
jgi:hypothetical protein